MNKKFIQQIQCLVTFLFMLVLTAVPNEARSQTPVKVTLSLKNVRMQAVMNEIEKQTKYLFVTQQDVDLNRIVSVEVRDRALSEALDQMTAGSGVEYVVKAPSIILSVKKAASRHPFRALSAMPPGGRSSGPRCWSVARRRRFDRRRRCLHVAGTPPAESAQLEINYLGYEPVIVTVGRRTRFDITMHESASEIESVVVTALGIKRSEKALAYTVAQVAPEDVTRVKDANFVNALSGKVAGAVINPRRRVSAACRRS